jgi:hypothetical protein
MAAMQAYLVRSESDGTMRTVQAQSVRGAMTRFVAEYGPPTDEVFWVKARLAQNPGSGGWDYFKVTRNGIRAVGPPTD